MGGTLTCSPLVFCFCLSCNSWNVFPLGNSKMLLRIRKKTPPAPPSKTQFSCETSLLPHQAGGWEVAPAIYEDFSPLRTIFVEEKTSVLVFFFCFRFINRLPPTGLRRVAALPAPGDS